jgi:hypothetical protein
MNNLVDITGHATYFYQVGNAVHEEYGNISDESISPEKCFDSLAEAAQAAKNWEDARIEKELKRLERNGWWWFVHSVRAYFSEVHKGKLDKFLDKVDALQTEQMIISNPKIVRLPKSLTVRGTRLALGDKLYVVDPYVFRLEVFEVGEVKLGVYNHGTHGPIVVEYYKQKKSLSRNNSSLTSDSVKPEDFVQQSTHYYYDVTTAFDFVQAKMQEREILNQQVYDDN